MSKKIKATVTFLGANGKPVFVEVKGIYEDIERLCNIVHEGEHVVCMQERSAEAS